MNGFINQLIIKKLNTPIINCDKQNAIYLLRNPLYHECTKYIDIRLHFILDVVNQGLVKL